MTRSHRGTAKPADTGDDSFSANAVKPRLSRIHFIVLFSMFGVVSALAWTTWSARSLVLTFVP